MSVVIALMVALTLPNDRPTVYKPVQYWEARGESMAVDMYRCKQLVQGLSARNVKASCEVMTRERLAIEVNRRES